MGVVVVTPPEPVVTFEEVEKHLADVPAEDRDYVKALTAAATAWIDGPAGWLGRAIGVQLLEWHLCDWPCSPARFPIVPVLEVESVEYVDPHGDVHAVPGAGLLHIINPPAVRGRPGDVRIRYWAGYGKRDETEPSKWISAAPAPIKVAIMMLVAQWYHTRENVITGTITSEMPFAVDALLQPFRVYM